MSATIGVLAVQGDVIEHVQALRDLGVEATALKSPEEVESVDGLIIPGGESTTVIRLMERYHLDDAVVAAHKRGVPVWGTCMGMIVLARSVADLDQRSLGLLDVTVRRNAFGRQIASAEVALDIPALGEQPFPAVFIRAPWIEAVGPQVDVLAQHQGYGVFVRSGTVLGTSFHPELTRDRRVHEYFLSIVRASVSRREAIA